MFCRYSLLFATLPIILVVPVVLNTRPEFLTLLLSDLQCLGRHTKHILRSRSSAPRASCPLLGDHVESLCQVLLVPVAQKNVSRWLQAWVTLQQE